MNGGATGVIDPAWVAILAPGGLDAAELASVGTWTDAAVLDALAAGRESERRIAALWIEALRRRLALAAVPGFSEKLAEWPDRSLREALGPFVGDYDHARRAALLLEAGRRRIAMAAATGRVADPLPLACVALASILGLIALAVLGMGAEAAGHGPAIVACMAATVGLGWFGERWLRPRWQRARDDA